MDDLYIDKVLTHCKYISQKFSTIKTKPTNKHTLSYYYVKMANAWLMSTCFTKFPVLTKNILEPNQIEHETFKMFTQKVIDSHRVSYQDKIYVQRLRQSHYNIKQCEQ